MTCASSGSTGVGTTMSMGLRLVFSKVCSNGEREILPLAAWIIKITSKTRLNLELSIQSMKKQRQGLVPVRWTRGVLEAVDATKLPRELVYVKMRTVESVCSSIQSMKVRGAPLIGV